MLKRIQLQEKGNLGKVNKVKDNINDGVKISFRKINNFYIGSLFTAICFCFGIIACDSFYFGKTQEELAREMFEVDSLMKTIHMEMDSVAMDFNKLYINAQRINNGSN